MDIITFNKSSNIFINSGIIGLYHYLKIHNENNINYDFSYELHEDKLIIQCGKLFQLLEDVYYLMAKEIYDTSGKNARGKIDKYFFMRRPFKAVPFFKMKTYGLGELITNDPQPTPKNPEDAVYFKDLINDDFKFANKIAIFYHKNDYKLKFYKLLKDQSNKIKFKFDKDQKGDSRIFLNQPYTKTPSLKFDVKYFESGNEECSLTGERYKRLVDTINTSPFLSGLSNFESYLSPNSSKISWKAMYLSRFSPKLCLYIYTSGLDSLVCYFFNSDNLLNLGKLYDFNRSFYKDEIRLIEDNYMSNFDICKFSHKKDKENQNGSNKDFVWQSEIMFMIIYTAYRRFLFVQGIENIKDVKEEFDPIKDSGFDDIPISLIYFKSDKFASTMRPNSFEYYTHFKYIIRLIAYLERNTISFDQLLSSLKFLKRSDRNPKKSYKLERKLRNVILCKILNLNSIIDDIEWLYYNCFTYNISNEYVGYKNYQVIFKLIKLYEPIIRYGGNNEMNQEIQEKAINLGYSIGIGILNYEDARNENDKKNNAKNARKYIISLNKSRTLKQFLDEVIRVQNKYHIVVSNDLLNRINESNWEYIKKFSLISALNSINSALSKKSENN